MDSRDRQLARDLMRKAKARLVAHGQNGGSVMKEVDFKIEDDDMRTAAETLEANGAAEIVGDVVTVFIDLRPAWLRALV